MLGKIEGKPMEAAEDEMVGWHHLLDGHELEQALGVSDGQGGLHAVVHGVTGSDTMEQLN